MKKEALYLKKISKDFINPKVRQKISKIKNLEDRVNLYKHRIKIELENEIHEIQKRIDKIQNKDEKFHLSIKLNLLKQKIKYFSIDHNSKDSGKVIKQIKLIKKKLKCLE